MRLLTFFLLAPLFAACGPSGTPELATLPAEWSRSGNQYWKTGTDTTGLFPNLDSLEAMGLIAQGDDTDRRAYVERNLKRRLVVLFRNNPRVVDSLFALRFPAWIEGHDLSGSLAGVVDALEGPATKSLGGLFRGPRALKRLGTDIPYAFPDSLKGRVGDARVRLQVALDAEGAPVAIEVLDPVNPTLDAIAVRAAAQQDWSPIYLNVKNRWEKIPGWVRYNVLFGNPGAEGAGGA